MTVLTVGLSTCTQCLHWQSCVQLYEACSWIHWFFNMPGGPMCVITIDRFALRQHNLDFQRPVERKCNEIHCFLCHIWVNLAQVTLYTNFQVYIYFKRHLKLCHKTLYFELRESRALIYENTLTLTVHNSETKWSWELFFWLCSFNT